MAFDEVQFPTDISYGSRGGPAFSTSIITTDSGGEERVARWSAPRYQYNAAYGVKSYEQLQDLIEFYIARLGPANGFRYKDFMDYSTDPTSTPTSGSSTPDDGDMPMVNVIDGDTTSSGHVTIDRQWQLSKTYTSGAVTRTRSIRKPVNGTLVVASGGVAQTEGVDFTCDYTTGIVTFSTSPGFGNQMTAGFEFDVPVRFGDLGGGALEVSIDAFDSGAVPDIPLFEIIENVEQPEEFYYGGVYDHGTSAATAQISTGQGRVHLCAPTGTKILRMPQAADLPPGGPYFYVFNTAANDVELYDPDEATLIVTVGQDEMAIVVLTEDTSTGVKTWRAAV